MAIPSMPFGRVVVTVAALLAVVFVAGCSAADKDLDLSTYVEQTDPADKL